MSFEYGGNGNFENHVVGFWGDFVAYITTSSDAGTDRFGDYVTIRRAPPTENEPGNFFTAFGFGVNKQNSAEYREEDQCAIYSLWQAALPYHSVADSRRRAYGKRGAGLGNNRRAGEQPRQQLEKEGVNIPLPTGNQLSRDGLNLSWSRLLF